VYDPSETRILVTHGSIGRDALLGQVALAVKADLTLSGALHCKLTNVENHVRRADVNSRSPIRRFLHDYSVLPDHDSLRAKYEKSQKAFAEVYESARIQLEQYMLPDQRDYLQKALKVASKIPGGTVVNGKPNQPIDSDEEQAWKNCWNWNLSEASFGQLIFDIRDGRVSARTYSQGLNFGYRRHQQAQTPQTAKENVPNKINVPQQSNSTQQLPTPASQPSQAAFSKFGQLPRKPIPTGPQRNQSQTAPVRPSPAQSFAGTTKPDAAINGTAGGKSAATESTQPAGPQGGSVYIEGTERGYLRRNERERGERPVRGGARGTQPRINGSGPATATPSAPRPTTDGSKGEDSSSTTAAQPTSSAETAPKDAPAATPVEESKEAKPEFSAAAPTKTETADDGWATAPSGDATGLPAPRASRLVEKNPHTLYVKGLPQPCTDDELRGLWKEDIRSKVSRVALSDTWGRLNHSNTDRSIFADH
jgi:RNA recognition motif-containing protein